MPLLLLLLLPLLLLVLLVRLLLVRLVRLVLLLRLLPLPLRLWKHLLLPGLKHRLLPLLHLRPVLAPGRLGRRLPRSVRWLLLRLPRLKNGRVLRGRPEVVPEVIKAVPLLRLHWWLSRRLRLRLVLRLRLRLPLRLHPPERRPIRRRGTMRLRRPARACRWCVRRRRAAIVVPTVEVGPQLVKPELVLRHRLPQWVRARCRRADLTRYFRRGELHPIMP